MKNVILEVRNLTFSYEKGKNALEDINVSIGEGEKIAVLGANGAGKSTFFLHLNGVRKSDRGEIFIDNKPVDSKKMFRELQKNVGIVFQDTDSQIIASTVRSEIAFGPINMKLSKEDVERYTDDAISQMKLEKYVERPPHYLSSGEKKRVGIADILAMKPRIIVFDEPTASLDPYSAAMLEEVLEELEKEGKTIMLSTHDVDFAYRFAERILVFYNGKLIADDIPEVIFSNEELLKKTNLKKPAIMEFCELLQNKNILPFNIEMPRNIQQLKDML